MNGPRRNLRSTRSPFATTARYIDFSRHMPNFYCEVVDSTTTCFTLEYLMRILHDSCRSIGITLAGPLLIVLSPGYSNFHTFPTLKNNQSHKLKIYIRLYFSN